MSYSHIAYIDEAGDEGFGKLKEGYKGGQSQWLLIGAVVVRGPVDRQLPSWRDQILARFQKFDQRDLHFKNLKHDQKVVVCQELASRPLRSSIVFSNKCTISSARNSERFKEPGFLYNYLTRWLLERVTTYCANDAHLIQTRKPRLKVVFSRRGGTDYQAMNDYLELMRDGREVVNPSRNINWTIFDPKDIVVENHSKWAGLQLADCVTSAFFNAVEPNFYGNQEVRYGEILAPTLMQAHGSAFGVGVTPVPSLAAAQPNEQQRAFFQRFIK